MLMCFELCAVCQKGIKFFERISLAKNVSKIDPCWHMPTVRFWTHCKFVSNSTDAKTYSNMKNNFIFVITLSVLHLSWAWNLKFTLQMQASFSHNKIFSLYRSFNFLNAFMVKLALLSRSFFFWICDLNIRWNLRWSRI